ncbi:alpha/beta hydrolase [Aspergillus affinis]|uniref:alpha/beta hydrolase n=1 Tax=Aspergillus affinis TaxID=1070780 RepID=UPI0022FEFD41|nr:alpha/beta-hydrolase [Aspergillus affinis]KAI9039358.1 alpha/beta-hydrolase [Aspergillus affinis]
MMENREKPTILLIPGAYHQGSAFEPVATILRQQGYQAKTITLLSAGGPASTTVHDDAEYIQKSYLDELVSQGKEVILVLHSYAGVPGTESVKGHARKDLVAQGKKGGVVGLVYLAAFLIPAGASVETIVPGGLDPLMTLVGDMMQPKNPRETFYSDLGDETAAKHLAALIPHAPESMRTPLTYEAYRDVSTSYIICTRDAVFQAVAQKRMADSPGEGVVRKYEVDGGHCAMLGQSQAVADVIHDVATRVAAA